MSLLSLPRVLTYCFHSGERLPFFGKLQPSRAQTCSAAGADERRPPRRRLAPTPSGCCCGACDGRVGAEGGAWKAACFRDRRRRMRTGSAGGDDTGATEGAAAAPCDKSDTKEAATASTAPAAPAPDDGDSAAFAASDTGASPLSCFRDRRRRRVRFCFAGGEDDGTAAASTASTRAASDGGECDDGFECAASAFDGADDRGRARPVADAGTEFTEEPAEDDTGCGGASLSERAALECGGFAKRARLVSGFDGSDRDDDGACVADGEDACGPDGGAFNLICACAGKGAASDDGPRWRSLDSACFESEASVDGCAFTD